jgi:hypothetical protein
VCSEAQRESYSGKEEETVDLEIRGRVGDSVKIRLGVRVSRIGLISRKNHS